MRKIALFCLLLLAVSAFGQGVELTPNGFVDKENPDKSYVVIDVPDTPKDVLFTRAKKYLNTLYNSPKFVTSEVANEQIVIDAMDGDSRTMIVIFRKGLRNWRLNYKYDFQFKDNRIKFTPYFKCLSNDEDSETIKLIGVSVLGITNGLYNSKGKALLSQAIERINASVNSYIEAFSKAMNENEVSTDDDW